MTRLIALGSIALVATASATAAPLKERVFGKATASGDYAIAIASGNVDRPRAILVRVTATPRQTVGVNWTVVCSKGFGAGSKSGAFKARAPVTRPVKLPMRQPDNCTASAGGSLDGSGRVVVSLIGR